MALEPSTGPATSRILARSSRLLNTDVLTSPAGDAADAILVGRGLIVSFSRGGGLAIRGPAEPVIDAHGRVVSLCLVHSHPHPVSRDGTLRRKKLGRVESVLHRGVATMVSPGKVRLPGRRSAIGGLRARVAAAQGAFAGPAGMKAPAGASILKKQWVESGFTKRVVCGVLRSGAAPSRKAARKMVVWARRYGVPSIIHTDGLPVPGSIRNDRQIVPEADFSIIGHTHGDHAARPGVHPRERFRRTVEVMRNGDQRVTNAAVRPARDLCPLHGVILGTESRAALGMPLLGILRLIALHASLRGIPRARAFALATAKTTRIRKLDANSLEPGRATDLLFLARSRRSTGSGLPRGLEHGGIPCIGIVRIDGVRHAGRSRIELPAEQVPRFLGRG